jgi:hypothetical protein
MAGNLLAHLRFLAIWSKESGAEGDLIVVRNVAICRNLSHDFSPRNAFCHNTNSVSVARNLSHTELRAWWSEPIF